MTAFADFLRERIAKGHLSTEDTLGSLLPLFRQVLQAHESGHVAPLRGVGALQVEGGKVWFEAAKLTQATSTAKLKSFETPPSLALEITGRGTVTTDLTAGATKVQDLRIGEVGQVPTAPLYLPGYTTWEQEIGQHDPLTDVFSLGMLLASLSCGLDFGDREDLVQFAGHRGNLFDLRPDLHPVIAKAILRMTDLDRHKRVQDLAALIAALETYRDQSVDILMDFVRAERGTGIRKPGGRRAVLLERLRERLFEITRRNRLLYYKPTLQSLNLTFASVPLLFDVRTIRPEQILTWPSDFATRLIAGDAIALGKYLRFEEAPYIAGVLDGIISEAKRDQAEFGFSQVRLVLCFLRWHNLKDVKEERIETPLVLIPVQLSRKKGVRDAYVVQAAGTEAEINPVLRYHLRQLYGIKLPETIDLATTPLESLHESLSKQILASEPGVTLSKVEKPQVEMIHEKARRRLDQYQRKINLRARGRRTFKDISYSYDRESYEPLGLKLYLSRVRPANAQLGDLLAKTPRARQLAVPDPPAVEVARDVARFHAGDANPYSWDFDLCSVTLGSFRYRKMTLVRDYDTLLEGEVANPAFESIFSAAPKTAAPADAALPPLDQRYPVVACDPTQASAIAKAGAKASYIIQGPPGTGKSQTITNLVADFVARGQKVLFVCEKRAAIDVVYHRLKQRGLHDLCCLIHDSQADKKEFIQDLKRTYEAHLDPKEAAPAGRPRDQVLQDVRRELEPLERFDEAMRSVPGHAGVSIRRLIQRRLDLGPSGVAGVPDYSHWASNEEAIARFTAALKDLRKDGVFSRHPLSLLATRALRETRPQDFVAARLKEGQDLIGNLAGAGETMAKVRETIEFAKALRFLAERNLLTLLGNEPRFAATTGAHRAKIEALAKAGEATKEWIEKLPRPELKPALDLARSLTGFFSFLKPSWWRLRGILGRRYRFDAHAIKPTWIAVLEALEAEYRAQEDVDAVERQARQEYGFEGDFRAFLARVEEARRRVAAAPADLRAHLLKPDGAKLLLRFGGLEEPLTRLEPVLDDLLATWKTRPVAQIQDDLDRIEEAIDELPDILPCLAEIERLPAALGNALRLLPVATPELEAAMAGRSLKTALTADRELARFTSPVRERHLARLEKLVGDLQESNARHLRERIRVQFRRHVEISTKTADQLSPGEKAFKKDYAAGRKELEHEFGKTMRYRSIRDLLAGPAGGVIQDLKPVWLMSPVSVSDTLPLDATHFDVVIYDEASQIPLEEGVPPLFRGSQVIVVGDPMQLPPTTFFSTRRSEDDELVMEAESRATDYDLESNSFLSYSARTLPSTMLGWHYRSRSESLISFSNARFYDRRLLTVPEQKLPAEGGTELSAAAPADAAKHADAALDRSISFHFMEKGVYQGRQNAGEAAYIAELVRALLAKGAGHSIGIVAFSEAQQGEIEGALTQLAAGDADFRDRLEKEYEREEDGQFIGLLVKNLENIQGDERDVVILSICYAKGPDGRMLMNFGPINQSGGEKRLNVAFSRAKKHMMVVSSIHGEEITNEYNDGASCLRRYLRYAAAVSKGDRRESDRILDELQERRKAEGGPAEGILDQVAVALRGRGYEVDAGVGHSELKCDLAVRKAGDRAYQAGLLIDTAASYGEADLLSRDVLRPSLLRSFGWRVVRLLAKDWVEDADAALDRIESLIRGEAETRPAEEPSPAAPAPTPAPEPDVAAPPAASSWKRTFTFNDDKSSKYWEIEVDGAKHTVRFGRIGTAGQALTKDFPAPAAASRDAERLIREKVGKGYQERTL